MSTKEKLKKLAEEYYDRLFRAALFMCGQEDVAEELVQETFLAAVESLGNFEGRSSHYTWLYGILLNKFRGWLRTKGRKAGSLERQAENVDAAGPGALLEGDRPEAAEELIKRETAAKVREALDDLPPHHRSVLVLRYIEDMSYKDIAETLGCSLGTVKSRIHYGLKRIAEQFEENEISEG